MTPRVENNKGGITSQAQTLEVGARVRPKRRLDHLDPAVSRKSVGTISEVLVSKLDGTVDYVVTFPKEQQTPMLSREDIVLLPKKQTAGSAASMPKATTPPKPPSRPETARCLAPPPELPDDIK